MKTKELLKMLDEGYKPIIKFNDKSTDLDGPNSGMLGKVISHYDHEIIERGEETIWVEVDLSDYVEYNKNFAIANFYDDNGNPCLTWFESKYYPKNNVFDLCLGLVESFKDADVRYFDVIEVSKYFQEYQNQTKIKSYVEFLEKKLDNQTK